MRKRRGHGRTKSRSIGFDASEMEEYIHALESLEHPTQSLRNRQDSPMGSRQRLYLSLHGDHFSLQDIRKTSVDFAVPEGTLSRTDGSTPSAAFKSENEIFKRQRCTIRNPARPQGTALRAQAVTTAPNTRDTLAESSKDHQISCEGFNDASSLWLLSVS